MKNLPRLRPIRTEYLHLKLECEKFLGKEIITSSDIIKLSEKFCDVDEKTLRNLWGYLQKEYKTHTSTLTAICKHLGYRDWEDFLTKLEGNKKFYPERINISSLENDEEVILGWFPERYCKVKYLGDNIFEVIGEYKSKVKVGDIFAAKGFRWSFEPENESALFEDGESIYSKGYKNFPSLVPVNNEDDLNDEPIDEYVDRINEYISNLSIEDKFELFPVDPEIKPAIDILLEIKKEYGS